MTDIRSVRKLTGMSQSEFGRYLGIPVVNIQHWEQGVSSPPKYVLDLIKRVISLEKGMKFL